MVKDETLVGAIFIYRTEVRAFTDKQIDLVKNFAAQAVIAIENTRLLQELRARTDDLSESLQQQTATSEVLQIISSSPSDLAPVFEKMLENATRVCGAEFGSMTLVEGDTQRQAALYNAPRLSRRCESTRSCRFIHEARSPPPSAPNRWSRSKTCATILPTSRAIQRRSSSQSLAARARSSSCPCCGMTR
jgi:hypothetical protein